MSTNIGNVTNFVVIPKSKSAELTWTDPDDAIVDGLVTDTWTCTKILRKTTGYPTSITDGVVVVSSTVHNQYQSDPFIDSGLEKGTTYYYSAFTVGNSVVDLGFNNEKCVASSYVEPFKEMTVQIDLSIADPSARGSYADDAVGAPYGKGNESTAFWQEFFGYRPCLFKNGVVVGYLDPNDYSKFEDGTSADITSGSSGDVMVEFPRRGLNIEKNGNILRISMSTYSQDDGSFGFNAHKRGSSLKDYFYIGAYYAAYNQYSAVTFGSISGSTPEHGSTHEWFRHRCQTTSYPGYSQIGFYQWTYLQCMYLLQYRGNTDSQSAHGFGYVYIGDDTSNIAKSGTTDTKGIMYGTSAKEHIKMFGIEDIYGNLLCCVDGIRFRNSSSELMISKDTFNTNCEGYINYGSALKNTTSAQVSGYIQDVCGTNDLGLLPIHDSNSSGSSSTYFCDRYSYTTGCALYTGGSCQPDGNGGTGVSEGLFCTMFSHGDDNSNYLSEYVGCRLMYL